MNWISDFFPTIGGTSQVSPEMVLLALIVAFIIGQFNAWCYKWTHRGISYSRTFTQALILISMAGALSMSLIMTNLLAAFGLLGGLAIIRFRTIVRDARDNVYVLLSLICGMAAGLGFPVVAVIGSITTNLVSLYMYHTGFGAWRSIESLLRFQLVGDPGPDAEVDAILRRFCRRHKIVSVDESAGGDPDEASIFQCVYKIRLRDPRTAEEMVSMLRGAEPVRAVHLLVDQENEEVA